ncbi:hypothetical protein [Streptomyces griseus]|uniref:hypothetical protein n=1 Tax=Streptomyces griseus TaxID=1911 RepID=UPI00380EE11C
MRRAIVNSASGLGATSPNPAVGCVILDSVGRRAGEGFHLRKGDAHAEVNALAAAGSQAAGGTAVVTLEPCNHEGLTPPCHQALLDARFTRVLIAVMDPTSRGEGEPHDCAGPVSTSIRTSWRKRRCSCSVPGSPRCPTGVPHCTC